MKKKKKKQKNDNRTEVEGKECEKNKGKREQSMKEDEGRAYGKECKEEKEGRKELKRKAKVEVNELPQGVAGAAPLTPTQPSYPPRSNSAEPAIGAKQPVPSAIRAINAELISNLFKQGLLQPPPIGARSSGSRGQIRQLQLKGPNEGEIRIRMEPQEAEW